MYPFNYRLTRVHGKIDEEIRREQKRPLPDTVRLLRLKKLRLAIKDRIHRLVGTHKLGMA